MSALDIDISFENEEKILKGFENSNIYNGIIDVKDEDYFKIPRVSASSLKRIFNEEEYEIANNIQVEKTDAMILGSLVHCLILENSEVSKRYVPMPKVDLRTKIGKETKAKFEEENKDKQIVSFEDWETAMGCYEAFNSCSIKDIFVGKSEIALLFDIDGEKAKLKLDHYVEEIGLLLDLKTTRLSGNAFAKECCNRDYPLQGSFYYDGMNSVGMRVERVFFVGIKTIKPYKITLVEQERNVIEFGREQYMTALQVWKDIKNNTRKYQSLLQVNPTTGENIYPMEIPNYKYYDLEKFKKQKGLADE